MGDELHLIKQYIGDTSGMENEKLSNLLWYAPRVVSTAMQHIVLNNVTVGQFMEMMKRETDNAR